MKGLSEKRLSDYMAEQIADEILAGRIGRRKPVKARKSLLRYLEHPESRSVKHFRFWRVRGLIVRLATKKNLYG